MNIRSGFVAIVGKPNVGKSTLMNELMGEKLSITTSKAQTTRKRVLGILTEEEYQIIFLDTPGILKPEYLLQEKLIDFINLSIKDSDIILVLISIKDYKPGRNIFDDEIFKKILNSNKKAKLLIINKIDLGNEKLLNDAISYYNSQKIFDKIIPISATEKYNIDSLLAAIIEFLPVHPKYYPDDQLTDEPERFFVSEIIREKILELYRDEVPYSIEVIIEEFKEREKGKDYISAAINVERESQKPIILGKNGTAIKKLGGISRKSIEEFLMREVFLELRVKVNPQWRRNPQMLKNFGYSNRDK